MQKRITDYFAELARAIKDTQVTDLKSAPVSQEVAFANAIQLVQGTHDAGNRVMFIGNGGSAGISSHCATDYLKNGGIRATAFNDGATLTCLGNDLGYDQVFAKQVDMHARAGDLLIAISSSGKSQNILNAANIARERGCKIITLSGFGTDNPLRKLGDYNFYVDSKEYGFVEIGHLALCHIILDLKMGWGQDTATKAA